MRNELTNEPRFYSLARQNTYHICDIFRHGGVENGSFYTEVVNIGIGTASTGVSDGLDYRCGGLCDLTALFLKKEKGVPISVEMVPRVPVKCRYVRLTNSSNLTGIGMWSEGVLTIDLPV